MLKESFPFLQDLISPAPCFLIKHSSAFIELPHPCLLFLPTASCSSDSGQTLLHTITLPAGLRLMPGSPQRGEDNVSRPPLFS